MNKHKQVEENYFPDQLCVTPERCIVSDWRSRLEVGDTACLRVWVGEENVFFFFFFKTKNEILKGPALAIFGRAEGKAI